MTEITPQELSEMIKTDKDMCIIDVRNLDEVEKASFPGAIHIPLPALIKNVAKIPQDKFVIVLCHHGARSLQACYLLKDRGFDKVVSLKGGIDLWSITVDPKIPRY